jgi:Domain of unknown function (DUF222)
MDTVPAFANVDEAMAMVHAGPGYLAAADATAMTAEEQARLLRQLEQADAVGTAARAAVLGAFTAAQGYAADAAYNARAWLIHRTGITRGAATAHVAWAKRAAGHPRVAAALAAGQVSESYARAICQWTGKLPGDSRDAAEEILLAAAGQGLGLADLASLAGEMYQRSRPEMPDPDPGQDPGRGSQAAFEDRAVRLALTFQGAGVMHGDLTPECAQLVGTVLAALSAPAGAEDTRTREQRYHDALAEAMTRLAASDLLPERAGQPVRAWVHVSLADLVRLEGGSALLAEWAGQVRARWAARRAAAAEGGGEAGAWLGGDAAGAVACDAAMAPVVTGEVDVDALEDLVRLCVELDRRRRGAGHGGAGHRDGPGPSGGGGAAADGGGRGAGAGPSPGWEALERAVIGRAVDLLSGPGGLAGFLRRRQLGARLGGPSLPLDIGYSTAIPAGIRHAVILRDGHCRWPGGCDQPAAACQVHHVRHKASGGPTSLRDCVLLCSFHHQVAIHRWGWTLVLNTDGTTTAWNKDKTTVLHSHGPPARAG